MPALQLKVTPAGRAALVNAENTGTLPVTVSQIGVTATAFDPSTYPASLPGEIKRLTTFGGIAAAPDTIHVTIRDDSADTYTLRGFALYLADGTLFASYGQAGVILEKSAQAGALLQADVKFADIDATSLTFGDMTFVNPPATTEALGVTRYATNEVGLTGTANDRSIVASVLKYVLDQRFGVNAPSFFVKGLLGLATAALFRASLELKSAALKDDGAGNGLDADKLDGQEGAYYLNYANLTGRPAAAIPLAEKGAASGVATLDTSGKVPPSQLPAIALTDVFIAANQAEQLAVTAQKGDVVVRSDQRKSYIHNGGTSATMSDWSELQTPTDAVLSVAGRVGAVTLVIADIGGLSAALAALAPLASPIFTGTPTAPTAAAGTNTTQLATTAFVQSAISAAVATLLSKNNPTFTGTMTGPAYDKVP